MEYWIEFSMHPVRSSENVVLNVLVILGDIFVYFRDLGNLE